MKDELKKIPHNSGVYIMKNLSGDIIYVGKAVNLRNRVRQYFNNNLQHTNKVRAMVSNVHSFEYIITDSELEALILECNLIKQYRPKFNILLKDDKGYPYIKVTLKEDFPRVLVTRKLVKDGSKYYGPYSSSKVVKNIMNIIREYFPTKKCGKSLKKKTRECLNYHIGKCMAPCMGAISKEKYRNMIDGICDFLEGSKNVLKKQLKALMEKEALNLNFERAAKIRDTIESLDFFEQDQKVLDTHLKDKDVVGFTRKDSDICIQIFFIREGRVIGRDNYVLNDVQDEEDEYIINTFICQFYTNQRYIPKEIYVPVEISNKGILEDMLAQIKNSKVNIINPKRGENVRLVELVNKNAKQELERVHQSNNEDVILCKLRNILNIKTKLTRIESYDVSNIGNENIVVAMVVLTNAKFDKKEYRKFRIKTTKGQNDYLSMQEALYRRLLRGVEKDEKFTPLPDLIFLDGGKGHVSAIKEVVSELGLNITLVGMVKDNRHRTKGLILNNCEIDIEDDRELFNFITKIQDETHRCALAYNKKLRKISYNKSSLDEIKGVGKVKKRELLKFFKSVDNIKNASVEELGKVKGIDLTLAKKINEYYRKSEKEEDKK